MAIIRTNDWSPIGVERPEPAALRAVRNNEENLCVVASAGAGKTEFLAQKADYLLSTGLCRTPHRILAISFKSDAARNLKERVRERCGPHFSSRFDSMTFDAFSKSLIDRFGPLIPKPYTPSPDYEIVFPGFRDWNNFLHRQGYPQLSGDTLREAVARCALPISSLNPRNPQWKDVLNLYWGEAYQDPNQTSLSFPMINRLANYALSTDRRLCTALRATYPFVFLDEFQDTTYGQYALLKRLFQKTDVRLTAVGDNKQRIMVWAGAMPNAFETFAKDFDAAEETLLSNWRSHPELVDIQHAIAVTLEKSSVRPEAKRIKDVDGDVCAIWHYTDREVECEGVTGWIADAINAGEMAPEDCAILIRNKPNDLEDELNPIFENAGLKLRNVARTPEGAKILIQDILTEELTVCVMALLRLSALPKSPDDWHTLIDRLSAMWGFDPDNEVEQDRLQADLSGVVSNLRQFTKNTPPSEKSCKGILQRMLDFIGEAELRATVPAYSRAKDYDRVHDGFSLLLAESAEGQTDWLSVIDRFDGVGQIPLMSVHRSKGLEFHTVIFFGLDSQSWWSFEPEDSEEMRAFFVAFTRAKQRVFFTSCKGRGGRISYIDELVANAGVEREAGPRADALASPTE